MIADSHCHVSPHWYEPVESLLFQMDRNGVEHAVLIQMQSQFDNSYQQECIQRFPGRFASVVIVDTDRTDALDELERLAGEGASGVRLKPSTRSPGEDPLAIWRAAERLGLPVSCIGSSSDFASNEFAEIVRTVPGISIVVEHLGSDAGPADVDPSEDQTQRGAFQLARFSNVYMKVPGLGEFCDRALPVSQPFPFVRPILQLLRIAYDAFGAGRLMWGSDYPPVSYREGYTNALRITIEEFSFATEGERDLIFGGVARSVFAIRG